MITFTDILIYIVIFISIYSTVYFLLVLLENKKNIRKKETKNFMSVTVIVPAYNEEKTLKKTIDSLLNLDYPKDKLKIVIIDDGSTDNTKKVGKEYAKQKNIEFYSKPNGGKHTALNFALERCNTDLVGALDADSFVDHKALKRIVSFFSNKKVMAVTPSMKIHNPKTVLQHIQRIEFLIGIFLRKIFAFLDSIHVTPGPFTIYRTDFFKKYGFYKKAYQTEDIEIALRIQSKNYRIENCIDAYVYTHGPSKFVPLKKQRIRWYRGFLENVMDYKELFGKKHGNLGLFVLPMSFVSVGLVIVLAIYNLGLVIKNSYTHFHNLMAVNFDIMNLQFFRFDLFFINAKPVALLGFLGLGLTVALIIITKKISSERQSILKSYVYFFFFYWILFAYWWSVSIYQKMINKKTSWGHKSE
ncbi:MAG: glycosyltransferase [Candidatus Woesearchaeota archaeon]